MKIINLLRFLIIFSAVSLLSACEQYQLLNNLTQIQANQVLDILLQHNIDGQKKGDVKSGYSIYVSSNDNAAALSVINQYHLPAAADVEISQALPGDSMISSPDAQQARIISFQEQRLAQTLKLITGVVDAKVHISYPEFNGELTGKKNITHAGILISYKGQDDKNLLISQIKSLIKNSLDDILYENISVVIFPAPDVRYIPPVKKPPILSTPVIVLLSILAIIIIGSLSFLMIRLLNPELYRNIRSVTTLPFDKSQLQQEKVPEHEHEHEHEQEQEPMNGL